jgi:hypothetical protein
MHSNATAKQNFGDAGTYPSTPSLPVFEDLDEESDDDSGHSDERDTGLRRSGRQRREPQRYGEWVNPDSVNRLYSDVVKGL